MFIIFCFALFWFPGEGGESFEGFGENETGEQVSGGGIDLVLAPHINSTPNNQ